MRCRPLFTIENTLLLLFLAPVMVFIVAWFRPAAALPAALGLVVILWRSLPPGGCRSPRQLTLREWGMILLLAFSWVALSGTGGIGFQNWDHEKHNAMLNDLILNAWPVRYHSDPGETLLVYYLPFYLLPALLGKAAGWAAANLLLWIQLLVFVVLTLAWIIRKTGAKGLFAAPAALLFIFFSGNDWIGYTLIAGPPAFPRHLEWWTIFNYMSVTTQLFWVPNSAASAWTGTVLFLDALDRGSLLRAFFVCLLTFFWCPYAALGMLPFLLCCLPFQKPWERLLHTDWKWVPAALPAAILALAYYSARSRSVGFGAVWLQLASPWRFIIDYVRFLVLEVLWLLPFLWYFRKKSLLPQDAWKMLLVACGALTVIPVIPGPGVADFIMKTSMPPLFVVCLLVIEVIVRFFQAPPGSPFHQKPIQRVMMALVILYGFGSLTAIYEIGRSTRNYGFMPAGFHHETCVPKLKPDPIGKQYLGEEGSFLRRTLRGSGASTTSPIQPHAATQNSLDTPSTF